MMIFHDEDILGIDHEEATITGEETTNGINILTTLRDDPPHPETIDMNVI